MAKPKMLYGHAVCKKCVNGFANRRQIAFVIDVFLVRVLVMGGTFAIGLSVGMYFASQGRPVDDATMGLLTTLDIAATVIGMFLIAAKDALSGVSPGKAVMGLRVVHQESGEPITLTTSLKRNWPALIPIMPLVMAVQMMKGPRAGDGIARTRVVWKKFAHSPVFGGATVPTAVASLAANVDAPVGSSDNPYQAPRY
jgi:uncharacterized RDD family membrane protein YckC